MRWVKLAMEIFFGIIGYILGNLICIVIIIGKGIINLREGKMRKLFHHLFRGKPKMKDIMNNRANREPAPSNNWTPSTHIRITDNMGMINFWRYNWHI